MNSNIEKLINKRIVLSEKLKQWIVDNTYKQNQGARPIIRTIEQKIEEEISNLLIEEDKILNSKQKELLADIDENDNVIFGIHTTYYDNALVLIKLSNSTEYIHYDIQSLGVDPPSKNLQYAKIHEVVTTEGSTMFGSLMHDEEEWFNIYGGPKSTQSCGILQLGNANGRFNLIAKTIGDTIQSGEMCGYPDGRLTWNGNDLAGSAIVAKSLSANGYVKYASGLIIQWGTTQITSIPHTINFPIPFTIYVRPVAVYNGATGTDTDLVLGWTESTLTITR
jgi:hypothetical protein